MVRREVKAAVNDGYNWYVLRTKPRSEHQAKVELSNQGYECYLPEIGKQQLRRGREAIVIEPLFPRYLFIRLSRVLSRWSPVRYTRGVTGFVIFGGAEPLPVSDDTVANIRDSCHEDVVHARIRVGDHVRLTSPNSTRSNRMEFWCQVVSLNAEGRATVLLTLLGLEQKIEIKTDRLVPA